MGPAGTGLGNEAAAGRKTTRATGTIALVALLALAVCAPAASAGPLSMTFTEDRANVGVQLSDAAMFEAPDTAPFQAQIGPAGESITAGVLDVPQFSTHITAPINADVTVDFEIGTITGSFTQTSGALTLSGVAGGTLRATGKECTVSTTPSPLTLSTAGNSGGANPRPGAPFTHGLSGPGAIAGQWTDMSATPVGVGDTTFCEDVEDQIEGPGGIWLDQKGDVAPPPPPPHSTTPPPSCIVPKLTGKTLAGAKAALTAANCTLGKPKRPRGKKRRALVVKSSNPGAGSTPADGKVDLTLGPKPRKAHH